MGEHKKQFLSGVAYTAVSKYAGLVIQLGITGVLSRLLAPEVFGVVAIALVLITFFTTLSDMGLGPAVIQHKDLTQKDIENLFCFSSWSGAILAVLFFGASWWIGAFYDSPSLVSICQVLSLLLLLASMNIVPGALMYRDKRFKFIAVRTMAVQLGTGVLAIVMAYKLPEQHKIYALIVQPLLSTLAIFVVNLAEYPMRLRWTMGLETVRKVFRYSAYQFLFNFINYFSRNLDKLVIGKYLNMSQLGYYEKSYRLMTLPLQNITNVLTPVMHPVFSDMQHDKTLMIKNYQRVVKWLALIGLPLSVVLLFGGREMMLLIFGMQWEPSVRTFQILSLTVGIQIILSSSGSILQAAGDTRTLFISGLTSAITNVGGMLGALVIYNTIEAVAWAMVISFTINFLVCYILIYRVTFRVSMAWFWRQFISPLILSAIILVALWGLSMILPHIDALSEVMNMIFTLGVKCMAAGAIWLVYVQLAGDSDILGRAKSMLRRR